MNCSLTTGVENASVISTAGEEERGGPLLMLDCDGWAELQIIKSSVFVFC